MPNYTKLFNSIVTSTIWTEDDKTRIVWITMLAISDQNGEVHASIPGLARIAGVSVADTETALGKFLSPDSYSRTPDNEGRRIAVIDGGWELLNHAKYRRMASKAEEKEANAARQRRFRARNATVTESNASVTVGNAQVTDQRDIAEADTETDTKTDLPPNPLKGESRKRRARSATDPISWNPQDRWTGITENDRADWRAAFPACDIDRQLASMTAWLLANPSKAKKSNWRKFIASWLTRSQDKGGDIGSNKPRASGCL